MKLPCDCCEGPEVLTPLALANRPGLAQLRYRVGTYGTFLETMLARLSSEDFPELAGLTTRAGDDAGIALLDAWAVVAHVLSFYQERIANEGYLRTATERRSILELARLIGYRLRPGVAASVYLAYTVDAEPPQVEIPAGTRASSVPGPGEQMQTFETAEAAAARAQWNLLRPRASLAQTVESINQHGLFLAGTATGLKVNDRLLIGHGSVASQRLVRVTELTLDNERQLTRAVVRDVVAVAGGTEAGTTVDAVAARYRAVDDFGVSADAAMTKRVLALLTDIESAAAAGETALRSHLSEQVLPRLEEELQSARDGGYSRLEPWLAGMVGELREVAAGLEETLTGADGTVHGPSTDDNYPNGEPTTLGRIVQTLKEPPSVPPPSARHLVRKLEGSFAVKADTLPRLLAVMQPALQKVFYTAWRNLRPLTQSFLEVHALRVAAAPFGHNAPLRQIGFGSYDRLPVFGDWDIDKPTGTSSSGIGVEHLEAAATGTPMHHEPQVLFLDNDYELSGSDAQRTSYIAVEKADGSAPIIARLAQNGVVRRSLAAYGLSGKTTQLNFPGNQTWFEDFSEKFTTVRNTRVFAGAEKLVLAERPLSDDIHGSEIELDGLYEDLEPGKWLIVSGERTDVGYSGDTTGVAGVELVMLAGVNQNTRQADNVALPQERIHTFITLAKPLAYRYKRATVKIYGNVIKATHGETRREVLGGGDAAQALQRFTLKQPPLTHVSAATVAGTASTLEVRVNDIQWHEVDSLAAMGPEQRAFITRTDDDAKTTVVFGNGARGARLPTGQENVKAVYRNGIGKPGNVKAEQISLATDQPLGVREVINPLRASGGADREDRDQARRNAPLAVMALDRLVSIADYADFARTFGGIGKAQARSLSDGRRRLVHVSIAGVDDVPIDASSDLYRNLRAALHRFGDPHLPIALAVRRRLALVISAGVRLRPDYQWETTAPKIRQAVLYAFRFDGVELGEDLLLSRAIETMQGVAGVSYVDVDVFDAVSEAQLVAGFEESLAAGLQLKERIAVRPAERTAAGDLAAAQLCYLSAAVEDTLILQELSA